MSPSYKEILDKFDDPVTREVLRAALTALYCLEAYRSSWVQNIVFKAKGRMRYVLEQREGFEHAPPAE